MLGFTESFRQYSAAADLDIRYTRSGVTWNATNGIDGAGAPGLNSFSNLTTIGTDTIFTLSNGGVLHGAFYFQVGTFFGASNAWANLFRPGTNVQAANASNAFSIQVGSEGGIRATKHGDSASVFVTSTNGHAPIGQTRHIEFSAKFAESPDGFLKVWIDRTLVIDFSGDTLTGTQPSTITGWRIQSDNSSLTLFDDVVLWDETGTSFTFTQLPDYHILGSMLSLETDAANFVSNPTSNLNENNIDDAVFHDGDTTNNESEAVGQFDRFKMTPPSVLPRDLWGIAVHTRARKTDVGAVIHRNLYKFGSTEVEGADKTLTTSFAQYSDYYGLRPDTSALAPSDLNNTYAGYKHQA